MAAKGSGHSNVVSSGTFNPTGTGWKMTFRRQVPSLLASNTTCPSTNSSTCTTPTPTTAPSPTDASRIPWELLNDIPVFSPTRQFSNMRVYRGPYVYRDRLSKLIRVEGKIPLPLKGVDTKNLSVRQIIDLVVAESRVTNTWPVTTTSSHPTAGRSKTIFPYLNPAAPKRPKTRNGIEIDTETAKKN